MSDTNLSEEAVKIAEGYDQGVKIRGEFEQLESEYINVDRSEIISYMEETGVKSATEAYNKLYGLDEEPASQGVQSSDTSSESSSFRENLARKLGIGEQAPTPQTPQNNSHYDNLRDQMADFFNKGGAK